MQRWLKRNISKLVFVSSVAILLGGLAFGFGIYSGAKRNVIFDLVRTVYMDVRVVYRTLKSLGEPTGYLQPSRKPGTGVTINERANDGRLVLLSGFFDGGNELRLIRRDGSPVARWPVRFSEHFPDTSHVERPPATDHDIKLHGALIHPDGSVVFNYEYGGTVKLSRCGETVWTLAHMTHHSVETAEAGGYWIAGRRTLSGSAAKGFPPFPDQTYSEDLILNVTEDGAIARQVSIPRILYDNGLEPIMTATGHFFHRGWSNDELTHLNKIGELPSALADAFKGFEAGDLVVSLRHRNLVLVVDPDDWRVKWHQTGPWRRQHDPEFNPDGTISVFNNNVYSTKTDQNGRSNLATWRGSNIIKIDPATGRTEVVYGNRAGQEFLTVLKGKQDPTPEGGIFITEPDAGRAFEVDARGRTVWEYINRYDAEQVLEMTGARLYPSSYFTVKDWSCPSTTASK